MAREFGPFLRLYAELRDVAVALENHGHHRKRRDAQRARGGGSGGANISARPGGSTPDSQREWSREAERRALVARVKAGGARGGDLLRYMELQDQDRQARG